MVFQWKYGTRLYNWCRDSKPFRCRAGIPRQTQTRKT